MGAIFYLEPFATFDLDVFRGFANGGTHYYYGASLFGTPSAGRQITWHTNYLAYKLPGKLLYPESAQKVVASTSVSTLTKALSKSGESLVPLDAGKENPMMVSPAYKAAKRLGNKRAAWEIAKLFTQGKRLAEYEKALEGKTPVFVPIQQEESERVNQLPIAAAWALQKGIGRGRVSDEIHQLKKRGNTGATPSERGSKDHDFTGALILNEGETAVLVDDTFTSGNTLAALFDYLRGQGVTPAHIFTMASGRYTKDMAASPERQQAAIDKAGVSVTKFVSVTRTTINTFTGAELQGYLLNGKPGIEGFLDRFDAKGDRGSARLVRGADTGGNPTNSITTADRLSNVADRLASKARDPEQRFKMYQSARERLAGMARAVEYNDSTPASVAEVEFQRQRAANRQEIRNQLYQQIEEDFGDLSGAEYIADSYNAPIIDELFRAPETRLDKNGKSSTMQITWKIAFGGAGGREAVFNYFAGLLNSPVLGTRKTDAGN